MKTIKAKIATVRRLSVFFFGIMVLTAGTSVAQKESVMNTELEKMGFKRISPFEIRENTFNMFANDWALLTSGDSNSYNTMTIGWGDFGVLWNKPIVTVYVSSSRYTKGFMDKNDYFTIEFFDEKHRSDLTYLGSHSGRDENKIAKTNLTTVYTPLGNATFQESQIIIEMKKIYAHEFDTEVLPADVKEWYKTRKIGLHTMYIGEIINVWIKE